MSSLNKEVILGSHSIFRVINHNVSHKRGNKNVDNRWLWTVYYFDGWNKFIEREIWLLQWIDIEKKSPLTDRKLKWFYLNIQKEQWVLYISYNFYEDFIMLKYIIISI